MSTFKMRVGTAKTDVKDIEILDQFTMFDEEWAVHAPLYGSGYRVSHIGTGYGVPQTLSATQAGARKLAEDFLTANRDAIQAVIAKVK